MKDEQLLKLIKLLERDAVDNYCKRSMGGVEVAIATPYYNRPSNARARRADIMLATLSEKELNDLRTILAIGRTARFRGRKNIGTRKTDDLVAWRVYLNISKLSQEESLKELRKMPPAKILENLNEYLRVKPMSNIRRNLINIIKRK